MSRDRQPRDGLRRSGQVQVWVMTGEAVAPRRPLPPRQEDDLVWYYLESGGDLGMRSQHAALEASRERGTAVGSGCPETTLREEVVAAATRQRRIRAILSQLEDVHQVTLRCVYGAELDDRSRVPGLRALGEHRVLALTLGRSQDEVARLVDRAAHGKAVDGEPMRELLRLCAERHREAAEAYAKVAKARRARADEDKRRRLDALRAVARG